MASVICVALNPYGSSIGYLLGKILKQQSLPCVLVTVISEHVEHLRLILAEALQAVVLRHHLVLMAGHGEINYWDQLKFNILAMFRCLLD